jgi:hypothetical protein
MRDTTMVGLISDTHGQLRREALAALEGCVAILHAGDVGGAHVINGLSAVATVHAVRGNVDDPHDPGLPPHVSLEIAGVRIHVSHGHELGSPTPARVAGVYDADVLVFGHTHKAVVEVIGGRVVVNPGAAGPARFGSTPSVARLLIRHGRATAEIIPL